MPEITAPVVPASPAPAAPVQPTPTAIPNAANPSAENLNSEQVKAKLAASDRARLAAPATESSPAPAEAPTPAESTPLETPVTPEAQPDGEEPADVLSNLASLDPKTRQLVEAEWEKRKLHNQEKIDKRIGKVTAEKRIAEQAAALAQQELNALRSQQVQAPTGPLPLEQIQDLNGLAKLQQEARQTIRDVERLLARDDISNGVQIGDKVWTKADLVEAKFTAQATLEDQIPARARFIQNREQATAAALDKFPFLKDNTSPEYAEAMAMFNNPEYAYLRNAPNAVEIVGTYLVGKKHLAAPAPAVAPKVTPKPPSSQTATSSMGTPARVAPEQRATNQVNASLEALKKKGNVTSADVRAHLKQLDLAKQR